MTALFSNIFILLDYNCRDLNWKYCWSQSSVSLVWHGWPISSVTWPPSALTPSSVATSPHTTCNHHPDLERVCLQHFAKAVFSLWGVLLTDPTLTHLPVRNLSDAPCSFLLPLLNYCTFFFWLQWGFLHSACRHYSLHCDCQCLSPQVRLCAPWGQGLGLSPRWPPSRIR